MTKSKKNEINQLIDEIDGTIQHEANRAEMLSIKDDFVKEASELYTALSKANATTASQITTLETLVARVNGDLQSKFDTESRNLKSALGAAADESVTYINSATAKSRVRLEDIIEERIRELSRADNRFSIPSLAAIVILILLVWSMTFILTVLVNQYTAWHHSGLSDVIAWMLLLGAIILLFVLLVIYFRYWY